MADAPLAFGFGTDAASWAGTLAGTAVNSKAISGKLLRDASLRKERMRPKTCTNSVFIAG